MYVNYVRECFVLSKKKKRFGEALSQSSVKKITCTCNNIKGNRKLSILHMTVIYQRFKGKERNLLWFSELADCSFMPSVSLICNLNFTQSLSKISGEIK